MTSPITSRTRRRRLAAIASTLPILAALTLAAPAVASPEPATGGNTTIALELPKRVKAEPLPPATANGTAVTLPNAAGTADVARGLITINLDGGIRFKANGRKADVTSLKLLVRQRQRHRAGQGQGGWPSPLSAALPSRPRSLGASVTGATLLVTEDGAKALNKALGKKKKKGKKKGKAVASSAKTQAVSRRRPARLRLDHGESGDRRGAPVRRRRPRARHRCGAQVPRQGRQLRPRRDLAGAAGDGAHAGGVRLPGDRGARDAGPHVGPDHERGRPADHQERQREYAPCTR